MPTWPATLPQLVLRDGFSETTLDVVIRTPVEAGPAKLRRRISTNVRTINCNVILTTAQVAIFDSFYVTDLEGGALSFTWTSQRTGAAATLRFTGVPKYVTEGLDWMVNLPLEILP